MGFTLLYCARIGSMQRMITGFAIFLFSLHEVIGNIQMTNELLKLLKGNPPKPDLNASGVDVTLG